MEGNKFTRKTKIILGIGFAIAIFGIMLIGVVPDLGAMVCGISLGLTLLYLFIVGINLLLTRMKKKGELEHD